MENTLEYGMVEVTEGEHKGRIGYYDDDDGSSEAIVYFGVPFQDEYAVIPYKNLKPANVTTPGIRKFLKQHPQVAEMLGVSVGSAK